MKEYTLFRKDEYDHNDSIKYLNKMAKLGWRVICEYDKCKDYLLLERDCANATDSAEDEKS